MNQSKHTLYLIGGTARSGKSIVSERMRTMRPDLMVLPTDFIRSIIRNALVGAAPINVSTFTFKGAAAYGENQAWPIEVNDMGEDALAWRSAVGLIERYDRVNQQDLFLEGVAITPEGAHALKLNNFTLRAAFIGYNNESHAESILIHAKENKDYIYYEMMQSGKGDEYVKENIKGDIQRSNEIREQAKQFGYPYFDATEHASFEEHVQAVVNYLTENKKA